MPTSDCFSVRVCRAWIAGASLVVLASGCSTLPSSGSRLAGVVTPYRIDVVQGNFVSREQVQALQPGMGRQQVRDILGTPLLASVFHADRWEYVFTFQRPGQDVVRRRLVVFFEGDALLRHEGDEMPSEAEFVASLPSRTSLPSKVPVLEATPEQLARYPAPEKPASGAPSDAAPTDGANYPPLEPPVR